MESRWICLYNLAIVYNVDQLWNSLIKKNDFENPAIVKDYVNDEIRKYHFAVNIADSSSQDKKPTSKSKKLISDDSDHSNNGKSKTKSKGYKKRVLTLKCVRAGKPTLKKANW